MNILSYKDLLLQMICFLLLTALTVSIDSFVCGFSLSLKGGKKLPIILGIVLTVFAMCLTTNYLTVIFANSLSEKTASLGGLILIGVGIFNLVKKDDKKTTAKKHSRSAVLESLVSGFAVGLDGAIANLSLSLMGLNAFYMPVIIALTHGLMISLGVILARVPWVRKIAKIGFIPPLILILLGGYKLLGFFI
jgi:putative Mn2+ efflux pump MntP